MRQLYIIGRHLRDSHNLASRQITTESLKLFPHDSISQRPSVTELKALLMMQQQEARNLQHGRRSSAIKGCSGIIRKARSCSPKGINNYNISNNNQDIINSSPTKEKQNAELANDIMVALTTFDKERQQQSPKDSTKSFSIIKYAGSINYKRNY